jgi:D-alanyl-D-alanine dipeptidase
MRKITNFLFALWLPVLACQSGPSAPPSGVSEKNRMEKPETLSADTIIPVERPTKTEAAAEMPASGQAPDSGNRAAGVGDPIPQKSGFSEVVVLDPSIKLDIRYATANNFTKSKIYDCPRCLLRPEAAEAIATANKALKRKGYTLKMFDCYRPRPYQQRLWDKVPNPDYVTPPAKGSMHSRGAAVDLTIVDAQGRELDMGTAYDFFGKEAHTDYKNLPPKVLENRELLRTTLEAVGFKGIRTEWWHFSYQKRNYALSDYLWPCP